MAESLLVTVYPPEGLVRQLEEFSDNLSLFTSFSFYFPGFPEFALIKHLSLKPAEKGFQHMLLSPSAWLYYSDQSPTAVLVLGASFRKIKRERDEAHGSEQQRGTVSERGYWLCGISCWSLRRKA